MTIRKSWEGATMIQPYTAVGLIPTFWGARRREDIQKNLEHLSHLTKAAVLLSNLDIPVRLVAVPEGALQGFNDEVLDIDHVEYAKTCAIDIPGYETDELGPACRGGRCSRGSRRLPKPDPRSCGRPAHHRRRTISIYQPALTADVMIGGNVPVTEPGCRVLVASAPSTRTVI